MKLLIFVCYLLISVCAPQSVWAKRSSVRAASAEEEIEAVEVSAQDQLTTQVSKSWEMNRNFVIWVKMAYLYLLCIGLLHTSVSLVSGPLDFS